MVCARGLTTLGRDRYVAVAAADAIDRRAAPGLEEKGVGRVGCVCLVLRANPEAQASARDPIRYCG